MYARPRRRPPVCLEKKKKEKKKEKRKGKEKEKERREGKEKEIIYIRRNTSAYGDKLYHARPLSEAPYTYVYAFC